MSRRLEDVEMSMAGIWKKYGYTPPVLKPLSKHPEYAPHKDCFAYWQKTADGKPECSALNKLYCMHEVCHFFKPVEVDV